MRVIIMLLTLTLSGCGILDLIKPGPGIAVDAQVGDRENEVAQEKKEVTVEDVKGDVEVNTVEQESQVRGQEIQSVQVDNGLAAWELILILVVVVGIALLVPSPLKYWKRN